jgi:SAM-dependent methyltransferase
MLLDNVEQTIGVARASLNRTLTSSNRNEKLAHFHLESLGISEEEKAGVIELALQGDAKVDPAVAYLIAATNGIMYKHLIGKLDSYPIPDLRLPNGHGETFLDIGCNWGRWCLAAARKNYNAIGIDPSLGAVMAARRVAQSLGLSAKYIVGDARYLPFPSAKFDTVFSYSVLQHFSREDVKITLSGIGRVLKPSGISLIQMPTIFGVRCLYHQIKRRFREARDFEVRYWSLSALKHLFTSAVGKTEFSVDCYFGIGLQKADWKFMTPKLKLVLLTSEMLRGASQAIPVLKHIADSVYIKAVRSRPAIRIGDRMYCVSPISAE